MAQPPLGKIKPQHEAQLLSQLQLPTKHGLGKKITCDTSKPIIRCPKNCNLEFKHILSLFR